MKEIKNCKKGFTLLELLVVVLIIGILAAIALPQYKKAVTKSKYATLKSLTKSFYQAQQVYYLTNNTYADTFDKLDISIGNSKTYYQTIDEGTCQIAYSYLFCKNEKINLSYIVSYTGKAYCCPYDNKLSLKICKEETDNKLASNGAWYQY